MEEKEKHKEDLINLVEDISQDFKKDIYKILQISRSINNTQTSLLRQMAHSDEKSETCEIISSYILALGSFLSVARLWPLMKEYEEKYEDRWGKIRKEVEALQDAEDE